MRKCFDLTLVIVLLVAGALAAAILWPMPVKAEPGPPCGPRESMVGTLTERYAEQRRMAGLTTDRRLIIEFWGNDDTGGWTITRTSPSGETCVVAVGSGFALFDPLPEGEPA